ncbi:TetR/AcrR family transcriptional regulator [Candidatus Sulfidibacterium hydrothermale]|uniref:TetR/AcrR family transcriptional regulator n=1 Tax=Candidatus Sulfidibacterium hydrothermale TaxID=2875962 RepID=UPI001F0B4D54|nr:TetR/AcrR family transcriptional regulator [Candidatus Sulfidibacterium hydrothermale]UBM62296.1 TetR/AcrR family transcriptional regulator [Candidatus Sulfidibacterium hydrothermale]
MEKTAIKLNTEEQILDAARKVFIKKGLSGARMQEIADEAQINKALLHYYFRSKEKLFGQIFDKALNDVFDVINRCIYEDGDIFVFIETFVKQYLTLIKKNPFIPNFIFNEITTHPERMKHLSMQFKINVPAFRIMVERNIKQKKIMPVTPEHFMIDLLGLCVFPYVSRPLIEEIFFKEQQDKIENFLEGRKQHITFFMKKALQA